MPFSQDARDISLMRRSRERGNPFSLFHSVIWIPAFAGMTPYALTKILIAG